LELRLKAEIHNGVLQLISRRGFKPRQLEKLFDVPQSRVSELMRGKLSLISVKKLLDYMDKLGGTVQIKVKYNKAA
jgi:predicted XRE-type DNA-binding protein